MPSRDKPLLAQNKYFQGILKYAELSSIRNAQK